MSMKPVIRSVKDSLDGMPIHVRQLAEMFRKHGQKQNRNTSGVNDLDATEVPAPLRNGWNTNGPTPNAVVDAGHGNRPHPSEYLDQSYIDQHLDRFSDGASRIYITGDIQNWGPGNRDMTFVFPTSELQTILDETGGDATQLALRLGMDADYYLDAAGNPLPVEIRHFDPSELTNLRLPDGNEGGANAHWIPGGYLPTGVPEAVIDIPSDATGWNNGDGVLDQSRWPGSHESFTLK
ncbi:hypothetical protein ACFY9N_02395 [Microbacterium sp. NPDC008134]|uniref:hypothetical protein n=1 Tax=Microbacterium sp. NPDC008134 TaxID=3364183 RepID=UPI0036EE5ED6